MESLNIFETIRRAQPGRTEPFHSQFLADSLAESLKPARDRSLFEIVWRLTAPREWCIPRDARVDSEVTVAYGRIDICLFDTLNRRVVGIEVKTTEASAERGQLEKYRTGLERRYSDCSVAITYLTPFNRERANEAADSLPTVSIFEEFSQDAPHARHVSWLDLADIAWDGRELWKQHRSYLRSRISSPEMLQIAQSTRSFHEFFGEIADDFWMNLKDLGVEPSDKGATIEHARFRCTSTIVEKLVCAFEVLIIHGDGVSRQAQKQDKLPEQERTRFLKSPFGEIHAALFDLSRRFPHVWVQGKRDYGIRVAHSDHKSSGVSLVRSRGEGCLCSIGVLR